MKIDQFWSFFVGLAKMLCYNVAFGIDMFFRIIVRPYSLYLCAIYYASWFTFINWHTINSFNIARSFRLHLTLLNYLNRQFTAIITPAKTIGYSQLLDLNNSIFVNLLFILSVNNFCGLRGKAPNESLGGNKMIRKGNFDCVWMIID